MNESVLNALMQLFALVAGIKDDENNYEFSKKIVRLYLRSHLSNDLTDKYLENYENYLNQLSVSDSEKRKKRLSSSSVKILKITEKINITLNRLEKFIVLFRVIEYVGENANITTAELDLLNTLAETFSIDQKEFANILNFRLSKFSEMPETENLLIIDANKNLPEFITNESKHIYEPHLDEPINVLYIKSIETFAFTYNGTQQLRLTGRNVSRYNINLFDRGSIIRGVRIKPVYQTEIANIFLFADNKEKIRLVADQIEFKFKNSNNGIHKVSFELESGQLVGIMGGSGAGKSTLLNLLIGKYPLNSGQITINGLDIQSQKKQLEGIVGLVPQDDLLIEELTVYQNLYYNAKLCFGSYTEDKIVQAAEKVLKELDLFEIRHLKVGNPLNKFISGGQRKRLNIALELIRQPGILFVDEPTSGLSSTDSEIVMDLLKHQALTGKLVVVNIHQPSSDIYKLFDKIWLLDKGGHPIYQGNPIDAIIYFKEISSFADSTEIECSVCGTVHPEEVLEIIEEKMVDEYGKYTQERKTSPVEWYTLFRVNLEKRSRIKKAFEAPLPKTDFKIPSLFKQFKVFVQRDVLSKLSDMQYMLINLLEPPLLALILAFFSKKIGENGLYVFADNINIPIFIFMSVVVAMFLGLSVSAEEIISDRRILEREKFLNLSRFSYLSSKLLILLALSAYQMFAFVLISNLMLGIKGMMFPYWLALFSTAAVCNILGLNISSTFKNVVTIYILIPLILVPQMLLGGAMIKYDDIHPYITSQKYVPFIGDIMFSRWAYEAIAVKQFKDNEFQKYFFEYDKEKSEALFISAYLVPELKLYVQKCQVGIADSTNKIVVENYLLTLQNEINKLLNLPELKDFEFDLVNDLTYNNFNDAIADSTIIFLEDIRGFFNTRSNEITSLKDQRFQELVDEFGKDEMIELKKQYHNEKLSEFVLDKMQLDMLVHYDNQIIRKKDPIYKDSDSNFGRAQFYAAKKYVGNYVFETFTFNIIILWLFSFVLFVALYFEWFKNTVDTLGAIKWGKFFGIFNRKK
ncbi:MAG: ATP-binding cassette domain-containing protein [Bacteroidales bacterium]|nr:ATP-binding cassette domain-containing protein [Bacteroidales bacterium]